MTELEALAARIDYLTERNSRLAAALHLASLRLEHAARSLTDGAMPPAVFERWASEAEGAASEDASQEPN